MSASDTPRTDAKWREVIDADCLPTCDSYGHDEDCMFVFPERALRKHANDLERELTAALSDPQIRREVGGWRPIESAPKDGGSRLYLVNGFCVQGFLDVTGQLCAQNDRQSWRKMHGKPTHWMPLPEPPRRG